jgi:hypothetical protein
MKYIFGLMTLALAARGGSFSLAIGSPAAASAPAGAGKTAPVTKTKSAASFAVRTEGCADPAKAQIAGVAEGLVNGARQSVALTLIPGGVPGVYLVSQEWPAQGVWVVNLTGTCAGVRAGALVPMAAAGFVRESSKFFPRPATEAEIEASLKTLAGGPK